LAGEMVCSRVSSDAGEDGDDEVCEVNVDDVTARMTTTCMRVVGCCEGACVAGGDDEACEGAVTLDVCELLAVSDERRCDGHRLMKPSKCAMCLPRSERAF